MVCHCARRLSYPENSKDLTPTLQSLSSVGGIRRYLRKTCVISEYCWQSPDVVYSLRGDQEPCGHVVISEGFGPGRVCSPLCLESITMARFTRQGQDGSRGLQLPEMLSGICRG